MRNTIRALKETSRLRYKTLPRIVKIKCVWDENSANCKLVELSKVRHDLADGGRQQGSICDTDQDPEELDYWVVERRNLYVLWRAYEILFTVFNTYGEVLNGQRKFLYITGDNILHKSIYIGTKISVAIRHSPQS